MHPGRATLVSAKDLITSASHRGPADIKEIPMRLPEKRPRGPIQTDRPLRVAFFLGSDITSHLIVNRLIPILRSTDISVVLFLTRAKPNSKRPRTLQQLLFLEHILLQEYAYPYVDLHGTPTPHQPNSPNGWQSIDPHGVYVQHVPDVNDADFVDSLPSMQIDAAISVRCYQKFRLPILTALGGSATESVFVNLHPGLLPEFRGVNTFLRAMQESQDCTGFTLHHLQPEWDTGAVIGQVRFPLSYTRSVLENMLTHSSDAASLLLGFLHNIALHRANRAHVQNSDEARYFSYPSEEELGELADRGIDVFCAASVIDALTDAFFGVLTDTTGLRQVLIEAVRSRDIPYEGTPTDSRIVKAGARR
jgi:Formyl transferase